MSVTSTSEKLLYLNTSLSFAERAKDLIGRLTLEEKVGLMNHPAHAIPRLNIPAYNYWSEALHGVGRNGRATVFPQAIGMAATWDKELIHRVANAISDEGRAKYHAALQRNGYTDQYQGLNFWSPNVNIFRDPRWGRGQETWQRLEGTRRMQVFGGILAHIAPAAKVPVQPSDARYQARG